MPNGISDVFSHLSIRLSSFLSYTCRVLFMLIFGIWCVSFAIFGKLMLSIMFMYFHYFIAYLYCFSASLQCLRSSSTCLVFWLHVCIGILWHMNVLMLLFYSYSLLQVFFYCVVLMSAWFPFSRFLFYCWFLFISESLLRCRSFRCFGFACFSFFLIVIWGFRP